MRKRGRLSEIIVSIDEDVVAWLNQRVEEIKSNKDAPAKYNRSQLVREIIGAYMSCVIKDENIKKLLPGNQK